MDTDDKPRKGVTFVEPIEVIGYSEPEVDAENEKKILEHLRCKYDVHPKKLFSKESESVVTKEAPKDFLSNLQNVMSRKLQFAEKSQEDVYNVGTGQIFTKQDNGAWVTQSQIEAKERIAKLNQDLQNELPE